MEKEMKKYSDQWLIYNNLSENWDDVERQGMLETLVKWELQDTRTLVFILSDFLYLEPILPVLKKYIITIAPFEIGYRVHWQVEITKIKPISADPNGYIKHLEG